MFKRNAPADCICVYFVALTMSMNSGLRLAPPTRKPSMSAQAASSLALAAVTEPPYWMRTLAATSADALVDSQVRREAWTSWACETNENIWHYKQEFSKLLHICLKAANINIVT